MKTTARTFGVSALFVVMAHFCGCTSEPIVSRKGVSSVAVGEIGVEALLVASLGGSGGAPMPEHFGNFDTSDAVYLGGVLPFKKAWVERDSRVDNGTRVFVNGRKRGFLPLVTKLRKPGPHTVRLEIPAFEAYTLTLGEPVRLRAGQGEIEAWPPVIVDCLTGEIFATKESSTMNPDRNSGTRKTTDLVAKAGRDPLLVVTTTDTRHPGWRKIGQLRVAWQTGR